MKKLVLLCLLAFGMIFLIDMWTKGAGAGDGMQLMGDSDGGQRINQIILGGGADGSSPLKGIENGGQRIDKISFGAGSDGSPLLKDIFGAYSRIYFGAGSQTQKGQPIDGGSPITRISFGFEPWGKPSSKVSFELSIGAGRPVPFPTDGGMY